MTGALPLELCWGLSLPPFGVISTTYVDVQTFGEERASTYCPVRPVTLLVLVVALVQHHGPDIVHLTQGGIVEVRNEGG